MEDTAHREMVSGGGPGGESFVSFVFVLPLAHQPVVPKTSIKEQFPQSKEEESDEL